MISKTWLMRLHKHAPISVLLGSLAALMPAVAQAEVAGQVQFVAGDVRIIDAAGAQRLAQKGQNINEGETVVTAVGSSAQLRMIDGGILALRPDTQLKVDTYVFKGKEDGSENGLLSLVKGGLRAITGLIGHENKEKLKLRTPTATIGIRGTDHEPVVLIEPAEGTPPPPNPPGTYDKVNIGATSLTTNAGTAFVGPNQVGFAASLNQPPVLLPKLPDFYRATPAPVARAGQHPGQASSTQSAVQSTAEPSTEASSASSSSESKTDTTTAVAVAPASELTGVNSSGETINLATQTLTTSSGQTVSLSNASSANSGSSGGSSSSGSSGSSGSTGGTSAPSVGNVLVLSFPYTTASGGSTGTVPVYFSFPSGLTLSKDATGNLTGVALSSNSGFSANGNSFDFSDIANLNQTGSTLTNFGSDSTTGISWGRWQGGTVVAAESNGGQGLTTALGAGSLHWIIGPGASPTYLPQVLTGSATYNLVGGTNPTDLSGNVGTLNSATLGVNFSTQTANANLSFTIGGNSWGMQSGTMILDGTQFSTTNCVVTSSTCTGSLVITKNGVVTSSITSATSNPSFSYGSIQGFLTGSGLNGAALEYSVDDINTSSSAAGTTSNNVIQGVAALSGPTQNIATPFRAVGISDGWNNISTLAASNSSTSTSVFNYGPSYHGSITGGEQPVASVVDGSGGLTSFAGEAAGYTAANSSVNVPAAGTGGPISMINVGTATNTDLGSATINGVTISWGRWAGGTVNIYSLDGSTLLGTIDNSNRSIHWITTSELTNTSFNLPTSGTATYTLAGNTSPTDYKGNTGTLNSVTLNADFGNAKVNTSINVSFNAANNTSTWTLTANNMPLGGNNGGGFSSDSAQNGVNGITNTVTCTGATCGSANHDYVQGHFVAGAQGAVIFYGMSTGNNTTSTNSAGATVSTFTPINGNTGLIVMKH